LFNRFSNTVLMGAPTAGDSPYMEVRSEDLPSRHRNVIIPTKAWVHRPRGSGEFCEPGIEVRTFHWSTAVFQEAIEKDLGNPVRAAQRWG
jgi:hypothetical protein